MSPCLEKAHYVVADDAAQLGTLRRRINAIGAHLATTLHFEFGIDQFQKLALGVVRSDLVRSRLAGRQHDLNRRQQQLGDGRILADRILRRQLGQCDLLRRCLG